MSTVNLVTGEIIDRPTEAQVRASVRRVIDHAESIWDEWAWQVERETWTVLGYASWDEMRRGEYGNLTSISAPRAERPELIARFRGVGLTQRETAETLGVGVNTVARHEPDDLRGQRGPAKTHQAGGFEPEVIDAEIVEDANSIRVPAGDNPHEYESTCHVDPSGGVNDLKRLLSGWDKFLANYYADPSRSQLDVLADWLGKHQRKTERARRNTP